MAKIISTQAISNNIYGNLFLDLVAQYNSSQRTKPNPFEVYLAAALIQVKLELWGSGDFPKPLSGVNWADIHFPVPSKAFDTLVKLKTGTNPEFRKAFNSTRINKLIGDLRALPISQPNAWQDFNICVDFFYINTNFIPFFTRDFKNGSEASLFGDGLGMAKHPNAYLKGLRLDTITDGTAVSTPAVTDIVVDTVIPITDDSTYFIAYPTLTLQVVYWYEVDGSGATAPAIPAPPVGVTQQFVKLNISSFDTPADSSTNLTNQILIAPGYAWGSVTTTGASTIRLTTATTGSFPASDLTGLPAHGGWLTSTFTDGTTGTGLVEAFTINFQYANATDLTDRFFQIYDLAGLSYLLYFNVDGSGTFVTPASLTPDFILPVDIATGDSPALIRTAVAGVLDGTGVVTTSVESNGELLATYTAGGEATNIDSGTAQTGVNYVYYPDLLGSDLSVLATGITDDLDYARKWRDIKVPYELTLGLRYPFLTPRFSLWGTPEGRITSGGGPSCLCGEHDCWIPGEGSVKCCNKPCPESSSNRFNPGFFGTSPFNVFEIESYNTPGNIFDPTTDHNGPVINIGGI